jgi:hypothetical protein
MQVNREKNLEGKKHENALLTPIFNNPEVCAEYIDT